MSKQDEGQQARADGEVCSSLSLSSSPAPISSYINCCTQSYVIFIRSKQTDIFFLLIKHSNVLHTLQSSTNTDDDYIHKYEICWSCSMHGTGV